MASLTPGDRAGEPWCGQAAREKRRDSGYGHSFLVATGKLVGEVSMEQKRE